MEFAGMKVGVNTLHAIQLLEYGILWYTMKAYVLRLIMKYAIVDE